MISNRTVVIPFPNNVSKNWSLIASISPLLPIAVNIAFVKVSKILTSGVYNPKNVTEIATAWQKPVKIWIGSWSGSPSDCNI